MTVLITNGNVTLTASQTNLISQEKGYGSQRAVLVLTNTEAAGGNTISVSMGAQATAINKGIILLPGQSFIWSMDSGYRPPNYEVNAYCSAGSPVLAVYEEIFVREV